MLLLSFKVCRQLSQSGLAAPWRKWPTSQQTFRLNLRHDRIVQVLLLRLPGGPFNHIVGKVLPKFIMPLLPILLAPDSELVYSGLFPGRQFALQQALVYKVQLISHRRVHDRSVVDSSAEYTCLLTP